MENTGEAHLTIRIKEEQTKQTVYIDILDDGQGISSTVAEQLFEPFYTTSHGGTGLGLYLSRELCIANRAKLTLVPVEKGSCFRISLLS